MKARVRWTSVVLLSAVALTLVVSAQTTRSAVGDQRAPYVTPRTPWGDPDLQGFWSNQTSTPLERPAALKGKESFTPE